MPFLVIAVAVVISTIGVAVFVVACFAHRRAVTLIPPPRSSTGSPRRPAAPPERPVGYRVDRARPGASVQSSEAAIVCLVYAAVLAADPEDDVVPLIVAGLAAGRHTHHSREAGPPRNAWCANALRALPRNI